jgi:hypothetical protein
VGKGLGGDGGGDETNVQCKPTQSCHNKCPLYKQYILIKKEKKIRARFVQGKEVTGRKGNKTLVQAAKEDCSRLSARQVRTLQISTQAQ